jgi:hypothetical protein
MMGDDGTTTPANLALNRPVLASSTEGTAYAAANAVDGNLTTRWSSTYSDPQWLRVDLGATYAISSVKLAWQAAHATAFQIQVSPDATTWTTIYSSTTGTGGTQTLSGLSGSGRYLRMYGTQRGCTGVDCGGTIWGCSLFELEVYGTSTADTQAPTVPGGVTATAGSSTSATVKWTASTDNTGVTGYDVYRNGATTPTGPVSGTTLQYVDSGLTASTTYSYTVRARDAAGNRSAASSAASVTTPATPPPATGDWSCGWGTFSLGTWPSACWRPFSSASAFNTRLPDNPRLVSNSAAVVANLMGTGGQGLGDGTARSLRPSTVTDDYYHPYFFSSSTDPEYTIYCTRGTPGATWYGCPVNGMKVRIPTHAREAGGTDHHMNVMDQASNVNWSFFGVEPRDPAGGTLPVELAGRESISGMGHYTTDPLTSVDTCSNAVCVSGLAGIIRQQELAAGKIEHALFLVIDCSSSGRVFPANPKNDDPGCANSIIRQGAWFRLNLTEAQIDAIPNIAGWQKTILKALRNYGMFAADEGINGAIALAVESPQTWAGRTNPWVGYAQSEMTKPNHNIHYGTNYGYQFEFGAGLSTAWWAANLQMVDPCVIQKTC